ncbi:hypothetical protein QA596_04355 [Balneolales bacterium ANBcel1]|nr:hypothetical protein [Balneolales bacterium ANBcel1]
MKQILFVVVLALATAGISSAQQTDRNFGLGVIVGEPTGISVGYWTADSRSFSGGAAWSFDGSASMHLHLDYLIHRFDIISVNRGAMPLYFGLGGRLRFGDDDHFGVRIPLGVAYHLENAPFEFFLEIVPVMDLVPSTDLSGNSGLGVRVYF